MAENTVLVVGGASAGSRRRWKRGSGLPRHHRRENPYLGGRVTQLNKYFWKMCPPNCGLEIQYKRIKNNGQVKIYTMAEVEKISGTEGNFEVTIKTSRVSVNEMHAAAKVRRGLPRGALERLRLG